MVDKEDQLDEMSFLVSITGKMTTILSAALREINLAESDKGAAALCIKYAEEIDKGNLANLAKFGPLLLQTMEALQMSPRARAQANKGVPNNVPTPATKLDELRNRRNERANRAKNVDTATS